MGAAGGRRSLAPRALSNSSVGPGSEQALGRGVLKDLNGAASLQGCQSALETAPFHDTVQVGMCSGAWLSASSPLDCLWW